MVEVVAVAEEGEGVMTGMIERGVTVNAVHAMMIVVIIMMMIAGIVADGMMTVGEIRSGCI